MDFSLLSPLEFFVVPKNGDGRNNKPPAMRVRVDCYTKNHLSVYNRVVQAVLQKGKVIYGEERIFTRKCIYFYKCLLKNRYTKNSSTFFFVHDIIIEC